jgi:class 3 adenylate cyclase/predicted ATPase
MQSTFLASVPHYLAYDFLQRPNAKPLERSQRFDAVVFFSDISGFTPLSEALGQASGKAGAEELSQLLNTYFKKMLEIIQAYGGMATKFGGDALTVLFPYNSTDQNVVASRAVQCALEMQVAMWQYEAITTSAGVFNLTMRIGVALGSVFCTTVGNLEIPRLEYIIAGSVLERCAEAEHLAYPGEVVLDNAVLPFLAEFQPILTPDSDLLTGFTKLIGFHLPVEPDPLPALPTLPLPEDVLASLAAFQHRSVVERFATHQRSFLNEHRYITVLFVNFSNFDYDNDTQVATKLQVYLAKVLQIIQTYDGYLRQVDMGDKGSKYIVLFGAPISHEDDSERALRCALELNLVGGIHTHIGISSGFAFCGLVGSDLRWEYNAIGDCVNLAARLMVQAGTEPGQILVSKVICGTTSDSTFEWDELAPLLLKGKTGPVEVARLLGYKAKKPIYLQEVLYTLPIVGRQAELEVVQASLKLAWQGQGQIIGVSGEAGIGKSRLVSEIVRIATEAGWVGYGGECQSYATHHNYLVWQNIWRTFFKLDLDTPLENQIATLQAYLNKIDPMLVARLPLLGSVLNLPIPDNTLTGAFTPKVRKESLEALLLDCLRWHSKAMPLMLVLEDCHWLDPLSEALLETVAQASYDLPILIVLAYRPFDTEPGQGLSLTKLPYFKQVALTDFTVTETNQLIKLKLAPFLGNATEFSENLVQRITERAGGNPFYIEELLNYFQDTGIDLANLEAALDQVELPDSLRSLIISRIDQLGETEKITLKVASVIGRLFEADWLWKYYPQVGAPEQVKISLSKLSRLDLTPLDHVEPELVYLFKHIITQEVAYESLAVATRSLLHEALAYFIEEHYSNSLAQHYDLLAYHYEHTNNVAKQREYYRKAGQVAQAGYANQTALDYYQKLLPLLNGLDQLEIQLEVGALYRTLGEYDQAIQVYQTGLDVACELKELSWQARFQTVLGRIHVSISHYQEAKQILLVAQQLYEKLGDQKGLAQVMYSFGSLYLNQGKVEMCQDFFRQALATWRELGDNTSVADALTSLGSAAYNRGDYATGARLLEEGIQLSRLVGDKPTTIYGLNALGSLAYDQGNYTLANQCFTETLALTREIGNRPRYAISCQNAASVAYAVHNYAEAQRLYSIALTLWVQMNDKLSLANNLAGLGSVATDLAKFEQATVLLSGAKVLLDEIEASLELAERNLFERTLTKLQTKLESAIFEQAWAKGQHMPLKDLIKGALDPNFNGL